MALDVSSSLAASLFQGDRAAASRTSVKDRDSSATGASRPEDFSASLDAAAAKAGTEKPAGAARAATKARAQRAMPGQIDGHQDTVVPAQAAAAPKTAALKAADVNGEAGVSKKAAATAKPAPCEGGAPAETADRSETVPGTVAVPDPRTSGETAPDETAAQAVAGEECDAPGEPESAAAEQLAASAALTEAVPQPAVTQPDITGLGMGVAPAAETATSASGETEQVAAVGVGTSGTAATVAATTTEALPVVAKTKDESTTTQGREAEVAVLEPDTQSQPGMTQQVAARAKAAAETDPLAAGKEGGSEAADKVSTGDATAKAEGKTMPAHEAPSLRGAVFQQVLEGFAHPGLHRAASVLSALDPAVAAQAQNASTHVLERPTPLQLLPVEIGMQAVRGAREFQIRLDPAELGRVDVKLHINDKGEVNATMIVERPETLQLLRRDAQTLAQAFDQAGLKQGENSLSFSLKGEGQQGQQQQQGNGRAGYGEDDPSLTAQVSEMAMRRVMIPNSSLDLMV